MAETLEDLNIMLEDLDNASQRVDLRRNMDNTRIMFNAHVAPAPVNVGNITLEVVDHYVYLGQAVQLVLQDQLAAAMQMDETFDSLFEKVDFPRSGSLPVLNRKVFRGMRVPIAEHPYVASVRRFYSHFLTGSLISKNLILTVAHPLQGVCSCELGVVVGENNSDRGTAMLTVVLMIIHEDFNAYTLRADIALLRVYEDITYRVSIKPVSLTAPYMIADGMTGFVTGWGRCDWTGRELCLPRSSRYFRGERLDPMLRTVKFTLWTEDPLCDRYKTHNMQMDSGMLCVGPSRLRDVLCPCLSIPGAPLVVNSRLIGIQSWGFGCGYKGDLPLVYTDIKQYLEWLVHNISLLKKISQANLTVILQATKVETVTRWMMKTRITVPSSKELPLTDIQSIDVDRQLYKLRGFVYDIRDFVDGGKYQVLKATLYQNLKTAEREAEIIKNVRSRKVLKGKGFFSSDNEDGFDFVVINGSLYDSNVISDEADDKEQDDDVISEGE